MGAGGLSPLAPLTLTTERQLPYVNERMVRIAPVLAAVRWLFTMDD